MVSDLGSGQPSISPNEKFQTIRRNNGVSVAYQTALNTREKVIVKFRDQMKSIFNFKILLKEVRS